MAVVIDASAAVDLLLGRPAAPPTFDLLAEAELLHAPHVLDVEVTNALRRRVRRGALSEQRASGAIADLLELPIQRYPHVLLLRRIWGLRDNLTSYDSAYVALAEALGNVPVLTADAPLARAIEAHTDVEAILYS